MGDTSDNGEERARLAPALRRCGLFRGLSEEQLAAVVASTELLSLAAAHVLFHEDEPADAMFVVLEGAMRVYTHDRDASEVALARIEAGEHLGEQSLLPGTAGRRTASVRAVVPTRLARIPRAVFEKVLHSDDALRGQLAELGTRQLRNDFAQLSRLAAALDLTVHAERHVFAAGDVLFRQGDEADFLYLIRAGQVAVYKEDEQGRSVLLCTVERGGCIGELALLRRTRRHATAIAAGPVEALAVGREQFAQIYQQSDALREHLATLERIYELPRLGTVTQHTGQLAGQPCITTLYHLREGQRFVARQVVGQELYVLERLGNDAASVLETLTFTARRDERFRQLRIEPDGTLVGIVARGAWTDAGALHMLALTGGRLDSPARARFLREGTFDAVEQVDQRGEPDPAQTLVCRCVQVPLGRLRAAIGRGLCTFDALQRETGCGSVCGGCTPDVIELLGSQGWGLADVVMERDEAPGIRSFVLLPRDPEYPAARAGQHIVVEGSVRGLRVRRSYTLSSPQAAGGRPMITVKREPQGLFSRWLVDDRPRGVPLRITRPQGSFLIDLEAASIGFLVAGIGVTPALAAVRTILAEGRTTHLMIHYSGRLLSEMAGIAELMTAAAQHSNIEVVVRETAREGRLGIEDVAAQVRRLGDALWYLCGPPGFLTDAARWLAAAGVAAERIHVEVFTPTGTPIAAPPVAPSTALARLVTAAPPAVSLSVWARLNSRLSRAITRGLAILNGPWLDWRVFGLQLNPLRLLSCHLFGRLAAVDPALPYEQLHEVTLPLEGLFVAMLNAFGRVDAAGLVARERASRERAAGRALPATTSDGNAYAATAVLKVDVRFPPSCAVNTGWQGTAGTALSSIIFIRGRAALGHIAGTTALADRGALPYHFVQQVVGSREEPACPGRKSGGIIAGQMRDNATWSEDRALTGEMFRFTTLDEHAPAIAAAIEESLAQVDALLAREPETVFDLDALTMKVSFVVLIRVLMGAVPIDRFIDLGDELVRSTWSMPALIIQLVTRGSKIPPDFEAMMNAPRAAVRGLVDRVRQLARDGQLTAHQLALPFVRRLLADKDAPGGGYDRLMPLLIPLFIAGHETTGHTLAWALYELARSPALEERVVQEVSAFRDVSEGRPLLTSHYDQRPVMLALIAETLRRYAPIGGFNRTADAAGVAPPDPETGIGSFAYAAGTVFVCSVIGAHHDPKRWPEPMLFQIERFFDGVRDGMSLTEQGQAVRRSVRAREEALDLIPFGLGPGRCTGQPLSHHESIMILDAILTRYRCELVDRERPVPVSQVVVLAPAKGAITARLRPRGRA